jgi:hypothetical protein
MAVTLCVSLWAAPGNEGLLVEYEDQVLALLRAHNGRLLQRVRTVDGDADDPFEVHVIEFAESHSRNCVTVRLRRRKCSASRWCNRYRSGVAINATPLTGASGDGRLQ